MKRLKSIKQIEREDYIKAINNNGRYIIFKSIGFYPNNGLIVDTNISGLESMIGKEEHLSKFALEHEFKLYRLNKFERWLYVL
jgi:hypothetical protein